MPEYSVITAQVAGSVDQTVQNIKDGLAGDEAYVGHIVDPAEDPSVVVVIVKPS